MNALRKLFNDAKPKFEEGGKLHAFRSLYEGFESFLFVSNDTSKSGVNIHDAIDSKRIMSMVVIALMPAMLLPAQASGKSSSTVYLLCCQRFSSATS